MEHKHARHKFAVATKPIFMRYHLLLILCFVFTLKGFSQADEESSDKNSFGEKLFLPSLEMAYINNNSKFLSDGILIKTSLEYRFSNPTDFFLRLSYDTYSANFEFRDILNFSNVVEGTASFSDLILGVGYREGLGEKIRAFVVVQGGFKFYDFPTAIVDSNSIEIGLDGRNTFTTRVTAGIEYYINNKSAITLDIFQNEAWTDEDFWEDKSGAWGISVGFITALF